MEKSTQFGALFVLFITIVVGIVLIDTLGDTVFGAVNTQGATNETVDASAVNGLRGDEPMILSNVSVTLASEDWNSISAIRSENGSTFALNTDYYIDYTEEEIFFNATALVNSSFFDVTNNTLVDYNFNPDSYVKSSIARTLLNNFIVLFFVLGLVGYVIYVVWRKYIEPIGI